MARYKKGICFMFLLLSPCLFMSGCYRGSVSRRVVPDHRQIHQAKSDKSQSSDIAKILAPGQWYVAFLALNGCILVFLILWGVVKAVFGAAPTDKEEDIQP
jgi:hypothetical protein